MGNMPTWPVILLLGCFISFVFTIKYTSGCYNIQPPNAANVSKNCEIDVTCHVFGIDCYPAILIKEKGSNVSQITGCSVTKDWIRCRYTFTKDSELWCRSENPLNETGPVQILVQEYLNPVTHLKFNTTEKLFTWKRPDTYLGINLEYCINLTYANGTVINEDVVNDTKYIMPTNFNECKYINFVIMAKATCGNLRSKQYSWKGTALVPNQIPISDFNISLSHAEHGVSVSIDYFEDNNCPSRWSDSAMLICYYKWNMPNKTYNLQVVSKNGIAEIVEPDGKDVILIANESACCALTLINGAGMTQQWRIHISTFSLQDFNFTSIDKTEICMKCWFIYLSDVRGCHITLKGTQNNDEYNYSLSGITQEGVLYQCFHESPFNGIYNYCVSIIGSEGNIGNCIIEKSVNITNSTDPGHSSDKDHAIISAVLGTLGSISVVFIVVIIIFCVRKWKKSSDQGTEDDRPVNSGVDQVSTKKSIQADGAAKLPLPTPVSGQRQDTDSPSSTQPLLIKDDEPVSYSAIAEQSGEHAPDPTAAVVTSTSSTSLDKLSKNNGDL